MGPWRFSNSQTTEELLTQEDQGPKGTVNRSSKGEGRRGATTMLLSTQDATSVIYGQTQAKALNENL